MTVPPEEEERLNTVFSVTLEEFPKLSWLVKVKAVDTEPATTDEGPVSSTLLAGPAVTEKCRILIPRFLGPLSNSAVTFLYPASVSL